MLKNLTILISTCMLMLILSECFFRFNHRYETYVEKTGICSYASPYEVGDETWYHVYPDNFLINNTVPFKESFTTNNEGCRDTDFIIKKSKYRILTIGDSFTEGIGATNDSTFSKQLFKLFLTDVKLNTEIWNAGISGSDPVFEYRLLKDKLFKYNPDMVILTVNSSDIDDIKIRSGFNRFKSDNKVSFNKGPWFESIYAKSRLFRTIIHDVFKYDWQFIKPLQQKKVNMQANRVLIQAVDSFRINCRNANIQFVLVFHPTYYEFENKIDYNFKPLISYCQTNQINCIDIRESFIENGIIPVDAKKYYWETDGHYNNTGYYWFSRCVYSDIKRLKYY